MTPRRWLGSMALGILVVGAAGVARAASPPAKAGTATASTSRSHASPPLKVRSVSLRIRHRVYPDYLEDVVAKMREDFPIADGDYAGRILEFQPDFVIDMKTHKATSRSNEPRNPAFRIAVKQKGVPHDTTWAFLNFPPHFSMKSLLAFQVTRVEFDNHAPIVRSPPRPDSAAARPAASPPSDTAAARPAAPPRSDSAAGGAKPR